MFTVIVPVRGVFSALGFVEKYALPFPVPLTGGVMLSQSGFPLVKAQGQVLFAVVMFKLPMPPVSGTLNDVGETENVHAVADCVTVNALPATVNVPVRSTKKGFAATLYPTEPSPVLELPEEMVIHMALLVAVRKQVCELAEIAI